MMYENPELNKNLYLIGLTRDADFHGKIFDVEFFDNMCVIIVKKKSQSSNLVEYVRYCVVRNNEHVNITKELEENVVNYELEFKKIIDRYFCMVTSSGEKVSFYEFDVDFLNTENASFSNLVSNVDYSDDNKQRGR